MADELPSVEKIRIAEPFALRIKFRGRKWRSVNLAGLIARQEFLAPLRDEALFAKARVIDWGAGVGWPGDMDRSASTLWRMSEEQTPFTNSDFVAWQERTGLSNQDAADALGLSLRTIRNIRASSVAVSSAIAIARRAMESDPTLLGRTLSASKARPSKDGVTWPSPRCRKAGMGIKVRMQPV